MDTNATVAMASDAACTESMVARSQSDTKSVASPTAVLERDLIGMETKLRGLADRRARVEAELVRITCEEMFLSRQQRRLLLGVFAAKHGEDPDAVDFNPEVEVAGVLAPEGFFVL